MKRRNNLFATPTLMTSHSTSEDITFNNLAIVRIWQGTDYRSGQVGHVSLEIPYLSIYASLWPHTEARLGMPHIIKPKWHTLSEDIIAEGKDPECTFYLFSLNITAMQKQFETRKGLIIGWLLQGESSLVRADTDNCTTLVYGLLKAGNMDALHSLKNIRFSSMSSSADWIPNQLAVYLSHVVSAERTSYPDTIMLDEKAKREGSISILPKAKPSSLQSTLFTAPSHTEEETPIVKKVFLNKDGAIFLAAGTVFILLLLFLLFTRATSHYISEYSPRLT